LQSTLIVFSPVNFETIPKPNLCANPRDSEATDG